MKLNSYSDLQNYLTAILKQNGQLSDTENGSPHGAFWMTLTYDQFVTGNVPGLSGVVQEPMPILIKGNAEKSNIIMALQGVGPFSPNGSISQMPADGPPYFTKEQIKPISDWINDGCPNNY